MLLFLSGIFLAAAAYFAVDIATAPARQRRDLLRKAAAYGSRSMQVVGDGERPSFRERVLSPTRSGLAGIALRVTPKASPEAIGTKLLAAGLGRRFTPEAFLAVKAFFALGGFAVGLLLGASRGFFLALVLGLVFGAFGLILPDFVVSSKVKGRRERIKAELSDALDLLAVSVEAGLGFDGAVQKLTEHMEGPLVDEFALTLNEMRIGESRVGSLKKMAARIDVPELSAFVRAVVQADMLGISLGKLLRTQAADARIRRQLTAEERAMKAPVKMLFPTVLFIFPAMFIVILGPAVLNIGELF
jgi:tight adherence protein C